MLPTASITLAMSPKIFAGLSRVLGNLCIMYCGAATKHVVLVLEIHICISKVWQEKRD